MRRERQEGEWEGRGRRRGGGGGGEGGGEEGEEEGVVLNFTTLPIPVCTYTCFTHALLHMLEVSQQKRALHSTLERKAC